MSITAYQVEAVGHDRTGRDFGYVNIMYRYGNKQPCPRPDQCETMEVMWADEDAQIGVLQDLSENAGIALGRALDLVAIHKLNPLAGTVSSLVTSGLIDTTKSATLANGKYDAAIETAVGLVIDAGFTPTGLAVLRPVHHAGHHRPETVSGAGLRPGSQQL